MYNLKKTNYKTMLQELVNNITSILGGFNVTTTKDTCTYNSDKKTMDVEYFLLVAQRAGPQT